MIDSPKLVELPQPLNTLRFDTLYDSLLIASETLDDCLEVAETIDLILFGPATPPETDPGQCGDFGMRGRAQSINMRLSVLKGALEHARDTLQPGERDY